VYNADFLRVSIEFTILTFSHGGLSGGFTENIIPKLLKRIQTAIVFTNRCFLFMKKIACWSCLRGYRLGVLGAREGRGEGNRRALRLNIN